MKDPLPRAQFRYLTRHFFGRFFDSELFATPGADMHLLAVQILALLVIPGALRTFMCIGKYFMLAIIPGSLVNQAVSEDIYFFLCLSMIFTGFITIFEWDSIFPDQKDFYILTPLPIGPKIIFSAKVVSLFLLLVSANVAINGIPILLYPGIALTHSSIMGVNRTPLSAFESMMYPVGNAVSLLLSSLFVFASIIAIRAMVALASPVKLVRTVSRCIQLVLILVFFCALFSAIHADNLIEEGNRLIYFLPPFWFLGIFEVFTGNNALIYSTLAKIAFMALIVSCVLSVLGYLSSYRSSMQKGFQSASAAIYSFNFLRKIRTWILHKVLLKKSVERASFHFIAQTVFRRQEHLLYWGSFISAGIALIYGYISFNRDDFLLDSSQLSRTILSFPLIIAFFTLAGLRYVFSVPADLNANWIFRVMDRHKLESAYAGIRKFMLCTVLMPLLVIFVPFYLVIWDYHRVLNHISYVFLLSWILIELLLLRFEKLPFTCTYLPGKANIKFYWPVYLLACLTYSFGTTALELWLFQDYIRYMIFVLFSFVLLWSLIRHRSAYLRSTGTVRFEEEPADQLIVLNIN